MSQKGSKDQKSDQEIDIALTHFCALVTYIDTALPSASQKQCYPPSPDFIWVSLFCCCIDWSSCLRQGSSCQFPGLLWYRKIGYQRWRCRSICELCFDYLSIFIAERCLNSLAVVKASKRLLRQMVRWRVLFTCHFHAKLDCVKLIWRNYQMFYPSIFMLWSQIPLTKNSDNELDLVLGRIP